MTSPTDLPALPDVPTPVTPARLRAHARAAGYDVLDVPEGPHDAPPPLLRVRWSGGGLTATLLAEPSPTLLVRARRTGTPIPVARRRDAEGFLHDWHRSRVWPTLVLQDEGEQVVVHAHVGVDVEAGLTDAQLLDWLRLAVSAVRSCFGEIEPVLGLAPPVEPT